MINKFFIFKCFNYMKYFFYFFIFSLRTSYYNNYIIYNCKEKIKVFFLIKEDFKNDSFKENDKKRIFENIFFTRNIRAFITDESNENYLKKILEKEENKNKFIFIKTMKSEEPGKKILYTNINSQLIEKNNFFVFKKKIKEFLLEKKFKMIFLEEFNLSEKIENIKDDILFFSLKNGTYRFFDLNAEEINIDIKNDEESFFPKVAKSLKENIVLMFSKNDLNIIGQAIIKKKNEIKIFSINDSYIGYGFGSIFMNFLKKSLKDFKLTSVIGAVGFYEKIRLTYFDENQEFIYVSK